MKREETPKESCGTNNDNQRVDQNDGSCRLSWIGATTVPTLNGWIRNRKPRHLLIFGVSALGIQVKGCVRSITIPCGTTDVNRRHPFPLIAITSATAHAPVAVRKDASIGRIVVAFAIYIERPGVGIEAYARVADNLVRRMLEIQVQNAELCFTVRLASVLVRLDEVEVDMP